MTSLAFGQRVDLFKFIVADLPETCEPGQPFVITDGDSAADCLNGGGSTKVLCTCDDSGNSYTATGDGNSGGAPAFSAITGGENTFANMVVGPGARLTHEGGVLGANKLFGLARKASAGTIPVCSLVHFDNYNTGQARVQVELADADAVGENPSFGIVDIELTNTVDGHVVIVGKLESFCDTSSFSEGEIVYLSTTPGEFSTRPTGSGAVVQPVAFVRRSHATLGEITVLRSELINSLPNLPDGTFWLGDASNQPVAVTMSGDATMTNSGVVTVSGGSGAFDDSGDPAVLNTTTKDVAIGTTHNNTAKLSVDGDSDQIQLSIQGNATQTTPLIVAEDSAGADQLTLSNTGDLVIAGSLTVGGSPGVTGDGTAALNIDGNGQNTTLGDGGTNGVQVTDAGAMSAIGSGSITATAVAAGGVAGSAMGFDFQSCAVFEDLAAADDNYEIFMANDAITIESVGCHCRGSCSTPAQISFEDRSGNAMTHTTPTCSTGTGNTTYQSVTAAGSLVAGEGLAFDVDNAVSPETDAYTICFTWSVD